MVSRCNAFELKQATSAKLSTVSLCNYLASANLSHVDLSQGEKLSKLAYQTFYFVTVLFDCRLYFRRRNCASLLRLSANETRLFMA